MDNLIELEHENVMQTYKRFPIVVQKAEGCKIYDDKGNVYLDFLGGIAVNALGHSHPKIIDAACEQIKKYMHISNYFYQEPQIKLAELICKETGYAKVFFSNSGTEATEAALKLARRWGNGKQKINIIGFSGGFHGRTYGALSVMDKPHYKDKMGPFLDNTKVIEYNDCYALEREINDKTAAIILEFVQGEGGLTKVTDEFVSKINELKKKYGFLIIADEIQAGMGRTGKLFAFMHYDIKPDVVTMAKGIGGGLPLGALLVSKQLEDIWTKGMHGTTYGGNAVACATGRVVLEELKSGLLDHVVEVGGYLQNQLKRMKDKYPALIEEVRGIAFMAGILLKVDAGEFLNRLISNKAIANVASGRVLRIVPPLIATKDDVDEFIDKLDKTLSEYL